MKFTVVLKLDANARENKAHDWQDVILRAENEDMPELMRELDSTYSKPYIYMVLVGWVTVQFSNCVDMEAFLTRRDRNTAQRDSHA